MEKTKYFTEAALEAIARHELKNFEPTLVTGDPRVIPIEEMVELYYGLELDYRHIRQHGTILGCTVFDDALLPIWEPEINDYTLMPVKGGTIIIDVTLLKTHNAGRLRFTIAHELAHWLIHQELYVGERIAAAHLKKTSMDENPLVERQANIIATSLLMPKGQVKRAFYAVRNKPNCVELLAKHFGVSNQAMKIFMEAHNMA